MQPCPPITFTTKPQKRLDQLSTRGAREYSLGPRVMLANCKLGHNGLINIIIIIISCIYKTCTEEIYAVTIDCIVETIDLCLGLDFSVLPRTVVTLSPGS